MSSKRKWDEKNHQTTWEDCQKWADTLWEDHHAMVVVSVVVPPKEAGIRPVVRVDIAEMVADGTGTPLYSDWRTFALRSVGEVEKLALYMMSQAQLMLDENKERVQGELPF